MAKRFIVGIDLGATNLKIALLDSRYQIKDKEVLSTQRFINPVRNTRYRRKKDKISNGVKKENLICAIIDSINKVIEKNNLNRANILGIGLGLPGPIDYERGVVHFFPNIPGWKEVGLKSILERRLRLPVFVDNDAKLMSLAEYKLGAAKGSGNAVCITLGTGVGGGIIINGSLYRGFCNASGEIGHMPINEKGPRCNCGGRACLETFIGNKRILKEARRMFRRDITLEELSCLARKQNRQAQTIWGKVAGRLAVALVGAVNLLNPDCIVIGGGVAGAGKILFDKVKKVISTQAMRVQAKRVKIVKATLGENAGLIGAAVMVRERTQ